MGSCACVRVGYISLSLSIYIYIDREMYVFVHVLFVGVRLCGRSLLDIRI